MAQRQFRTDDTDTWAPRFGSGGDGAYAPSTGTDAPIDSACTGTSGTTSLSATNASFAAGQLILIHQTQKATGAGVWEFNKIASYTAGTITTSYNLINTYAANAQVLVMKQYSSALIDTGITLTGKAWNGTVGGIVAWFCTGTTTVTGNIFVKGSIGGAEGSGEIAGGIGIGFSGGKSEQGSGTQSAYSGEGTVGASSITTSANGNGGGGGVGFSDPNGRAGGGSGGHASAGTTGGTAGDGSKTPGTGGGTSGNAALTIMTFGGGAGGSANRDSGTVGGAGAGGGIVLIVSKTITVTGAINSSGGAGADANVTGSGGAGGSILLKGEVLTLGSNLLTSLAGAAGGGAVPVGKAGSEGRIHADYATSISGSTNPTLDSSQDLPILTATTNYLRKYRRLSFQ